MCSFKHVGVAIECDLKTDTCTQGREVPDSPRNLWQRLTQRFRRNIQIVQTHLQEEDDDLDNILDHINNYPLLYNMTVVIA